MPTTGGDDLALQRMGTQGIVLTGATSAARIDQAGGTCTVLPTAFDLSEIAEAREVAIAEDGKTYIGGTATTGPSHRITVYDANQQKLGTFGLGKTTDDPDRICYLTDLFVCKDGICALDTNCGTIQRFTATGTYVGKLNLFPIRSALSGSEVAVIPIANGDLYLLMRGNQAPRPYTLIRVAY